MTSDQAPAHASSTVTAPAAEALAFRTPFERHVEIVRGFLARPRPTGDALVDAGARDVRVGLAEWRAAPTRADAER